MVVRARGPGDLKITGNKSLVDIRDNLNQVTWNRAESNLLETMAHVLQIFDCCYAGSLGDRGDARAFEYLAACGADQTTPRPGPTSFTSALIWALEELRKDLTCFTTSHLSRKILEAPNFPKDQKPEFRKRPGFNPEELIMLKPLGAGDDIVKSAEALPTLNGDASIADSGYLGASRHPNRHQDILTLKFVFEVRLTNDDVRKLGKDLNHIVQSHQMAVNRIMWGGLVPRRNDSVFRAVSHFKSARQRRASRVAAAVAPDDASGKTGGGNASAHGKGHHHAVAVADAVHAAAAKFAHALEDDVESEVREDMHKEIHDEVRREFEAQSQNMRARKRSV